LRVGSRLHVVTLYHIDPAISKMIRVHTTKVFFFRSP
jgi:hypothetical protein